VLDGDQDSKPKGGHLLRGGDHTRKFLSNEMEGVRGQGRRILSKATSAVIPPTGETAASNATPKVDRKRVRHEEKEEKKRAKREEKEKEAAEKARARKDAEERERFKRTELKKREKLEKQLNAASETTKRLRLDLEAFKSSSSTTIRDHADKIKERDVEIQRLNKTILRLQQCALTPNPKSNSPVISCSSVSPSNDPSILGLLASLIEQRNHVPVPLSVAPTPL
jgi:flagellar biosynthesis GTPase FlhF